MPWPRFDPRRRGHNCRKEHKRLDAWPAQSAYPSGMSSWSDDEVEFLQSSWQSNQIQKWLSVACPHCLHADAFTHVGVSAVGVSIVPGSGLRGSSAGRVQRALDRLRGRSDSAGAGDEPLEDEPLEIGFPPEHLVACKCGHQDHGEATGCGRASMVKTSEGAA